MMVKTSSAQALWLAFRPKTLTAAVVPVAVGTALLNAENYTIQWPLTIFALLGALFIQIGTNLFNDLIDFKKGADTSERLGPQRATHSGWFSEKFVLAAAVISFLAATVCGVPLVIAGGWPIVWVGLLSLLLGYVYTGGPRPLAYVGLGDIFVILFFGLVAVVTTHFLHSQEWSVRALIAGFQVGFLATVLIAINNTRDMQQDQKANKLTLAVRFGLKFSRLEITSLIVLSYLLQLVWFYQNWIWAFLLPMLTLPMALKLLQKIWSTPPGREYNQFLVQAAQMHLLFGLLLAVGMSLT